MSAAHKLATHEPIEFGTTAAPAQRPAGRPAPRKRFKPVTYMAIGSVWMVLMFLSFSLIQKNAAIRTENGEMMRMREEISQLEQANRALEGQIANQVSVAEVEKWARARGMKPPSGTVHLVQAKPEAVAVRPAAVAAETQTAKAEPSFWQSLLAKLEGTLNQAASGKR